MWLYLLLSFLLALGFLMFLVFTGTLKSNFFSPKKEGRKMTGRHEAKDATVDIDNLEPWRVTHHLYQSMSFESADEVAIFLASEKRPGRRHEWNVLVPPVARFKTKLSEKLSEEEFMDFYLDTLSEKLRS